MRNWFVVGGMALALMGCRDPQNQESPFAENEQPGQKPESRLALPTPTPSQPQTGEVPRSEVSGGPRLVTTPGEIATVAGNSMVLQTAEDEVLQVEVNPNTAIRIEGPEGISVGVDALQPGMMIRASWREQDGQKIAERIDITGLENPPGSSPYNPGTRGPQPEPSRRQGAQQPQPPQR